MPCPFFEPQQPTKTPKYAHARLPLIDEYDGLCHAGEGVVTAPESTRFACCNHGYSKTDCGRLPHSAPSSALRYTVTREVPDALHILCVEEREHIPVLVGTARFDIALAVLSQNDFNGIVQAQALAFCRGYTARVLRR